MPAPGMPFPERGQRPRASPSARSASIPPRWLWEKRMAQSSRPGERAASGLGSRQLWEPPRKGYSWLFYKYIYIFCSKVLLPHVRAGALRTCSHPQTGLERVLCPRGGLGSARGAPTPHWGSCSRTSPAVALPVPVAVSTAKLFMLFSDVIFKTSDIACLLGHCWQ